MDTTAFDAATRLFGSGLTRRAAIRGLVAGVATLTAGGMLLPAEDGAAKRRRRKNKKRRHGKHHDRCGRHGDGCGAYDADTGEYTPPYCCHGYECVYDPDGGSWTCQAHQ
jgi:hypothetical protein